MKRFFRNAAREIQRRADGLKAATRQVDGITADILAAGSELARAKRAKAFDAMERARVLADKAAAGARDLQQKAHAEHLRFGEELATAIAASSEAPMFTADTTDFALVYVAQRAAAATAHALTLLAAAFETADAEYRTALSRAERATASIH